MAQGHNLRKHRCFVVRMLTQRFLCMRQRIMPPGQPQLHHRSAGHGSGARILRPGSLQICVQRFLGPMQRFQNTSAQVVQLAAFRVEVPHGDNAPGMLCQLPGLFRVEVRQLVVCHGDQ